MVNKILPSILPDDWRTPEQIADEIGQRGGKVAARTLREEARRIGAYRLIGRQMFLSREDLERIAAPRTDDVPNLLRKSGGRRSPEVALEEARVKLENAQLRRGAKR